MKRVFLFASLVALLLAACAPVDLNAAMPIFETGVDSEAWAQIPAGEFYSGQHAEVQTTAAYEIMLTDVTVAQYAAFLNAALVEEAVKVEDGRISGYYPGDVFHGYKHEERIAPGNYIYVPLDDPSQRIQYNGTVFSAQPGYENHPMTMVSWFGARGYCEFNGGRLPTELEWEKAARGSDMRPFPWGDEIAPGNANYYDSRDPFEAMASFGSRTSPVGFYNGKTYAGYATLDSTSPYGLYDMAGNVWQWTGDVYAGMHYRFMRGGSKDTYAMDLRIWVRNNATPIYVSPGVGFRCARDRQ